MFRIKDKLPTFGVAFLSLCIGLVALAGGVIFYFLFVTIVMALLWSYIEKVDKLERELTDLKRSTPQA